MKAVCNHCGAQYEFDASTIPPEGYNAQCSTCNQVFFIKPEVQQPQAPQPQPAAPQAPAAQPAQLNASCNHCGMVYQFTPESIPAAGYNAQCTSCGQVFFVPLTTTLDFVSA